MTARKMIPSGLVGLGMLAAALVPAAAAQPLAVTGLSATQQIRLAGVSCPAASRCVAVGTSFDANGGRFPLAERWNGVAWAVQATGLPSGASSGGLAAVSCSTARACTAVGAYVTASGAQVPLVERWNGRRWALQAAPAPSSVEQRSVLSSVSCASARACTAVGNFGDVDLSSALAERWNGKRWVIEPTPSTPSEGNALNGVSCTSARRCIAAGSSIDGDKDAVPLAERWNGRKWQLQSIPTVGSDFTFVSSVSCASARACSVVGHSANLDDDFWLPVAERWNGQSWHPQAIAGPAAFTFNTLTGVSCASAVACVAVGFSATSDLVTSAVPLAEQWNGAAWTIQPVPGTAQLSGVSCSSATACTAVGGDVAERWNGSAWTIQPTAALP